jgi:DNA polymerase/3'-5' exonuclease PolX
MSKNETRLPLNEARMIAERVVAGLEFQCFQISIAGSIRRERPTIGDIEIVCVPKPYDASPLFQSGIATVVNQWEKIRGELPCRYTQRILPEGMKLDLFMVDPEGYGLQLAIRTGSDNWCRGVLARAWVRAGFRSKDGLLRRVVNNNGVYSLGSVVPTRTERELFEIIDLPWVEPVDREFP